MSTAHPSTVAQRICRGASAGRIARAILCLFLLGVGGSGLLLGCGEDREERTAEPTGAESEPETAAEAKPAPEARFPVVPKAFRRAVLEASQAALVAQEEALAERDARLVLARALAAPLRERANRVRSATGRTLEDARQKLDAARDMARQQGVPVEHLRAEYAYRSTPVIAHLCEVAGGPVDSAERLLAVSEGILARLQNSIQAIEGLPTEAERRMVANRILGSHSKLTESAIQNAGTAAAGGTRVNHMVETANKAMAGANAVDATWNLRAAVLTELGAQRNVAFAAALERLVRRQDATAAAIRAAGDANVVAHVANASCAGAIDDWESANERDADAVSVAEAAIARAVESNLHAREGLKAAADAWQPREGEVPGDLERSTIGVRSFDSGESFIRAGVVLIMNRPRSRRAQELQADSHRLLHDTEGLAIRTLAELWESTGRTREAGPAGLFAGEAVAHSARALHDLRALSGTLASVLAHGACAQAEAAPLAHAIASAQDQVAALARRAERMQALGVRAQQCARAAYAAYEQLDRMAKGK